MVLKPGTTDCNHLYTAAVMTSNSTAQLLVVTERVMLKEAQTFNIYTAFHPKYLNNQYLMLLLVLVFLGPEL